MLVVENRRQHNGLDKNMKDVKRARLFFSLSHSLYPPFFSNGYFFFTPVYGWEYGNVCMGWPVCKELKTLNKIVFTLMMRAKFERCVNMVGLGCGNPGKIFVLWEKLAYLVEKSWNLSTVMDSLSLITRSRFASDFSVCIAIHCVKIFVWLRSNETLADFR